MGKNSEYRFWTRDEFYKHLMKQADHYGYKDRGFVKVVAFDTMWNPREDFNGCNVVQDMHHPYLPCAIHDYRWIVQGGGIEYDWEFAMNLVLCGMPLWKARMMFVGVRVGWLAWYKWKYMVKRSKKREL